MTTLKTILIALAAASLSFSQDPPKPPPAPEQKKEEPKPDAAKPAAAAKPAEPAKTDAAKPADAPKAEEKKAEPTGPLTAEVELGVRVNGDVHGNFDAYRSMVNLGEGLRIMNWDIQFRSDSKALRKAYFRGAGWGGDPSAWLQVGAENSAYYRLRVDYRSTAYFNSLPSYANPNIDKGIFASQRTFDTTRNNAEVQLDLFPTSLIIPYVSYSRDRGFGRGVSVFQTDGNEYPVATDLTDLTNLARGGIRIERKRYHLTLEQGGLVFSDGQSLFQTSGQNFGNVSTPVFGRRLYLSDLLQSYDVDGSSIFSRGLATAQPTGWLDLSASFQYSKPRSDVSYHQFNQGLFIDFDTLNFLTSQNFVVLSAANQPHTTAGMGAEVRPAGRLRVLGSWLTDRLHNASSSSITPFADRFSYNYSQEQIEAVYEITRRFLVRGGQRFVWGESVGRSGQLGQNPQERGELRRSSILGGVGYRATDLLSFNADAEVARADKVLYRTSLSDFERLRMRGRYYLSDAFHIYGAFQYTNNSAPANLVPFEFRSLQSAAGVQWIPKGKTVELIGEYARSTIRSDLTYLSPDVLQPRRSFYRDNAHTVTGLLTWRMAVGWTFHPTLTAGGSMFLSSGTRPTSYYQPVTRLTAPVTAHLDFFGEYKWYGIRQSFYLYEGFRTHQGTFGIRIH